MTEVSETFSPGQDAGNQFERLVQGIEAHFQTSEPQNASLDGKSDGDVEYLMHLMNTYTSDSADWEQYAYSDPSRNYTRNRVADLGGKANLLILVWNPKKRSPVHDHARAHCIMKILQGSIKEEMFVAPATSCRQDAPMQPVKETIYEPNEVTYICDGIGLHRISNASDDGQLAVSLHLYTPPNAADFGYSVYEEKTGKRSLVRMSL